MRVTILPGKARGKVSAPPSKSLAHRLLIASALCDDPCEVIGFGSSEDVMATWDCLQTLKLADPGRCLEVRESGSTLRFLIPLALTTGRRVTFAGTEKLLSRPLSVYEEICREDGFLFERGEGKLSVSGFLKGKTYRVPGNISSQFVTGLLFALPGLADDSRIILIPPVESRPYIDMTRQVLTQFGVENVWENDRTIMIPGGQKFTAPGSPLTVEGDYSSAAFLEAFNLFGGDVSVEGLSEDSLQGDKIYRKYFADFPEKIDLSDCPDLGPILFAVSAAGPGAVFTGTRRLKLKESDRLLAMREELAKFGVCCEEYENSFVVKPGKLRTPEECLDGHNDHRVVMALSVLATLTGGTIEGAEAVSKSFPEFFEVLSGLGIPVRIQESEGI